jgi:ATP-dependent HslUV protease ATP-binding subunit HslU
VKVEATKFTEVGYVGKDVESIIRDLADVSYKLVRDQAKSRVRSQAEDAAEDRLLDALLPRRQAASGWDDTGSNVTAIDSDTRQKLRKQLREGALDDREIELDFAMNVGVEIMTPPGMEEMSQQLGKMFQNLGGAKSQKRKLTIRAARPLLVEEEAGKLLNDEELRSRAVDIAEQNGIVFIDEIDKVAQRSEWGGAGVSREGVQRDLLPLVEGSTVSTKYGAIKTDHILFIASGAFSLAKPSDLIPELQGRLPIRVELSALSVEDFKRILREPNNALTKQYVALLQTEGVTLEFTETGVDRLADVAFQVNERTENIGARRLHTVMERLLERISFEAADKSGEKYLIDAEYVDKNLSSLVKDEDLSRYIL